MHALADKLILSLDNAIRTIVPINTPIGTRPNPSVHCVEAPLSSEEQAHIAGLMRVNHSGEVAAQALYQGQAIITKDEALKQHLRTAADEEKDHLAWCEQRLTELNSHVSLLTPCWYAGSFLIGVLAGWVGDKVSLGFLAETERQVTRHLQSHLERLPKQDEKTRVILQQMIIDETQHAQSAVIRGGIALPAIIQTVMHWSARLLTISSYYL